MRLFAFIGSHLVGYRGRYLAGTAAVFLEGAMTAAPMIIAGLALVVLTRADATPADIWPYGAAIVLATLFRIVLVRVAWLNLFRGGGAVTLSVRERVAEHMRRVPLGILSRWTPARLANLLTDDARWIYEASTIAASLMLAGIVSGVALLIAAIAFNLPVGLAAAGAAALSIPALAWAGHLLRRMVRRRVADVAEGNQRIGEYAEGIAVFRSFGRTGAALETYRAAAADMRDTMIGGTPPLSAVSAAGRSVLDMGVPLALIALAALLAYGEGAVPKSAVPTILLVLASIGAFSAALAQGALIGTAERAARELDRFLAEPVLGGANALGRTQHLELAFESVSFGYGADETAVQTLADISFIVPPGTTTAIVGASGAGKSTIAALILRFFDVTSGRITLDGCDIRDLDPSALQAAIAFVGQDVHLFRDTLRANILLGDPSASDARLREVVAAARLDELVAALADGLDTIVGDGGRTLSGGERQRVAIARALLKNAPIIVLDEATSAIDPITELALQRAFAVLARGRTLIVVAHRLRTIAGADCIVVLDRGRIVESGRHERLLEDGGLYARLWNAQARAAGWSVR
ncbi:ABC transporter [Hyphomicrobium nitrativorans NL23]|uniref:ABC transporter n=1 Tax=Hyphomicrobium nitrativorans NL23 TaxID=1029756 RepID=V5SGM2_9HYPH|nr:ABC transporter ATP-binding protein/permease [Hyphomicrobium nitrativorans]AHB49683.1 ABC transporter [Hyphomicrobium nitrativorans NL23]